MAAACKTTFFGASFSALILVAQLLLLTVIPVPAGGATAMVVDVPLPPAEAAVEDCWKAAQVLQADSCAMDVFAWLLSTDVTGRVGEECCTVFRTVGDKCIHHLFPDAAIGALYVPLVKRACDLDSS